MAAQRTWALDLDGTLLRLPVDIAAVRADVVELFAGAGVAANPRPILSGIQEAARLAAPDDIARQAAWYARGLGLIEAAEMAAAASARPCSGARELLDALGQEPVAIVTNNAAAPARAALERCGLLPGNLVRLVGREPGHPAKPSPEPLLRALLHRTEPLGQIICVGDRPSDMAMAVAAREALVKRGGQVIAIAIPGDFEGEGELREAGADEVLPSLADLLQYLSNK